MGRKHVNAVFEPEFENHIEYSNGEGFPAIWITEPTEYDKKGRCIARDYLGVYPSTIPGDGMDPFGWMALDLGGRYYDEGMACVDADDEEHRVNAFRSAELLYRHAQALGNPAASLCLGYVYSYDRCAGNYYDIWMHDAASLDDKEEIDSYRKMAAFQAFEKAAGAGLVEGMYKFGDCYSMGIGCEPNIQKALDWYQRAEDAARLEESSDAVSGSIQFRLARCFENGEGCNQDFNRAARHYRLAVTHLQNAVDEGNWFYQGVLAKARKGLKRSEQADALSKEASARFQAAD